VNKAVDMESLYGVIRTLPYGVQQVEWLRSSFKC